MSTLQTISAFAVYDAQAADTVYATMFPHVQNGVVRPEVLQALVMQLPQHGIQFLKADVATIFSAAHGKKVGKSSVIKPAGNGITSQQQANLGTQIFHDPEADEIGLTIGADRYCKPTTILVFRTNDQGAITSGSVFYHNGDGKTQVFDCSASPNSRLVSPDMLAVHASNGSQWLHVSDRHAVRLEERCKEKDLDRTNIARIREAYLSR